MKPKTIIDERTTTQPANSADYVSAAMLLQAQNQLRMKEQELEKINEAIKRQLSIIEKANIIDSTLPDLCASRKKLLADIALGEKKQPELDQINDKIAEQQELQKKSKAEASKIIRPAEDTINGLNHKLTEVKSEIGQLQEQASNLFSCYLMTEAEQLGVEYEKNAEKIFANYCRLLGLNRLVEKHPGGGRARRIALPGWNSMNIPTFSLKSIKDTSHGPGHERRLFSFDHNCNFSGLSKHEQLEIDRMKELGIEVI